MLCACQGTLRVAEMDFEPLGLHHEILLLQEVLADVCHGAAILPVRWSTSKTLLLCQLRIPSFGLRRRRCERHPNTEQIRLGSPQHHGLVTVASVLLLKPLSGEEPQMRLSVAVLCCLLLTLMFST